MYVAVYGTWVQKPLTLEIVRRLYVKYGKETNAVRM